MFYESLLSHKGTQKEGKAAHAKEYNVPFIKHSDFLGTFCRASDFLSQIYDKSVQCFLLIALITKYFPLWICWSRDFTAQLI